MAKEKVVQAQEEQVKELAQEKGMSKEEFLAKAAEAQAEKDAKEETKQKKQTKKKKESKPKETKTKRKQSKVKVVGVKDLEAEFKIPGKTIRRYLRRMEENTKPRGPEPYQWKENSKEFKAIRANLQEIVKRKPAIR